MEYSENMIDVIESKPAYKRKNWQPKSGEPSHGRQAQVGKMVIYGLQRRCKYPDNEDGRAEFERNSQQFIQEILSYNAEQDDRRDTITPSIELWCTYIGITRQTLLNYKRNYSEQFLEIIQAMENAIASFKWDSASRGEIAPLLYIYDHVNNHGGRNTNQIIVNDQRELNLGLPTTDLQKKYLSIGEPEAPELPE